MHVLLVDIVIYRLSAADIDGKSTASCDARENGTLVCARQITQCVALTCCTSHCRWCWTDQRTVVLQMYAFMSRAVYISTQIKPSPAFSGKCLS